MGVRGRDLFLWLFFLFSFVFILGTLNNLSVCSVSVAVFLFASVTLSYYPYVNVARKRSRKLGLEWVVLLPLFSCWAKLLLCLAGRRMERRWCKAFEVHVEVPPGTLPWEFVKKLSSDLELAAKKFPGCLFLWESAVPIPTFVRKLIRDGWGFWEEGRWFVPRFPFTARELKGRRVKRGAVVVPQDFGREESSFSIKEREGGSSFE